MFKQRIVVMLMVVAFMVATIAVNALPAFAAENANGQTDSEIYHQPSHCIPQPYNEDSCQRHNISEY
jgi:hypothetical protein